MLAQCKMQLTLSAVENTVYALAPEDLLIVLLEYKQETICMHNTSQESYRRSKATFKWIL